MSKWTGAAGYQRVIVRHQDEEEPEGENSTPRQERDGDTRVLFKMNPFNDLCITTA